MVGTMATEINSLKKYSFQLYRIGPQRDVVAATFPKHL